MWCASSGQRQQLRLAVAVGEHREHEEVEPVVDRLVEGVENARLVAIAALAREQLLRLVAAVASEVGVQQVDHRPQMPAFFDVDLEQVAQVVQARTALPQPALLLDARRLGVSLRDDQTPQLVAELAGHFLPDRLPEEITEANPAIVHGIGKEDPPSVFGQLDVLEVRPTGRIDAHRRPHVHLVIVLEALGPHVAPPLDVGRLPVLERALQALVAGEADVVGDSFGGDHRVPSAAFRLKAEARRLITGARTAEAARLRARRRARRASWLPASAGSNHVL
jgi:hypothetical protein